MTLGRHRQIGRQRDAGADRGSAAIVVMGVVALVAVVVMAIGRLGQVLDDAARAQTAADAAALAAVHGGRPQADELAASNGAIVTRFEQLGHDVVVEVRVGSATATARASDAV